MTLLVLFNQPTGGGAGQTLSPPLVAGSSLFFAPSVAPGYVGLAPPLLANSQTFFAATVTPDAVTLAPIRLDNVNGFFGPMVSSVAAVAPGLLTNGQNFFAPIVSPGPVGILPGLLTNAPQIFAPTVTITGSYMLTAEQAAMLYGMYLLHGLKAGSPLTISQTQRLAGGLDQAIAAAGGAVTITTNSAPGFAIGDVGTMVEELAALHGITAALNVTDTARTAGAVVQTMQLVAGVTTVTRQ